MALVRRGCAESLATTTADPGGFQNIKHEVWGDAELPSGYEHFQASRRWDVGVVFRIRQEAAALVDAEDSDAVRVLVRHEQKSTGWIDGKIARCLAFGELATTISDSTV